MPQPVNWDDFTSWPPLEEMTETDQCHANAALIRDLTELELTVEPTESGMLIVACKEHFRMPAMWPELVNEFLEGFRQGCEIIAARWAASL